MKFIDYFKENYGPHEYSCLMLDCSELTEEIEKLQEKIATEDLKENRTRSLEHESHITILYGLTTSYPTKVLDAVPMEPIRYKIVKLSLFENEENDVLKFQIESDQLSALNAKIAKNFENENKYPTYQCHMTIAYLKPGKGKKYLKLKSPIIGLTFQGNVVDFSSKNGNHTFKVLKEDLD